MLIFTSICRNYIPRARVLANSVKHWMPDCTFVTCLCEREFLADDKIQGSDLIVLALELGIVDFENFIMSHTLIEASTAVKGQLLRYLMNKFERENNFVYLDPDIKVYSDFIELKEVMNSHSIVLCPHLLCSGNIEMELSACKHGAYNLGFLAVSRNENSLNFVNWWTQRLYKYCYDDIKNGIFTDQKWLDLAPCFFEVFILKHYGYDYATWSLMTPMDKKGEEIFIKGFPLRFIHFSSALSSTIMDVFHRWNVNKDTPFLELYEDYKIDLYNQEQKKFENKHWSYERDKNGKVITDNQRKKFRERKENASFHIFKRMLMIVKKQGIHILLKKIMLRLKKRG